MARPKDREKALCLRKRGMSYSQIKRALGINKSTLSLWLRRYPLSKQRIKELKDWNEQRIERFRETMRKKRENRLKKTREIQKKIIFPLNKRELFLAGLFLYWGEGTKSKRESLCISNNDPSLIKFFIYWLRKSLRVDKKKMKVCLHLYNDMDADKEIRYWSKILKIPPTQFSRPYIKKTSSHRINHKGGFGHGTCNLTVNSAPLAEKVLMGLKVIGDNY